MRFGSIIRRELLRRRLSLTDTGFSVWRPTTLTLTGCRRRQYSIDADRIQRSQFGMVQFPDILFHECVYEEFGKWDDGIALECGVSGRKYTFAKLMKSSKALAASLQNKFKLSKGDTIAIFMPNTPEYPIILLAGSEAGIILTTVNSTFKHEEIAKQLRDSDAKIIFTIGVLYPLVDKALNFMQKKIPIVVLKDSPDAELPPGTVNFTELTDPSTCGQLQRVDISTKDVFVLPYSSGTTGLPKGVQLTHKNMVSNILQTKSASKFMFTEGRKNDVVIGVLPMFHIYGMTVVTFVTLHEGRTLVTLPKFDPSLFVEAMVKHKASKLYLVPPLIIFLCNHPLVTPDHLKYVRYVINGAAPCGQSDAEKLMAKGKNLIVGQGYGLTETSPVVLFCNEKSIHKVGGAGIPIISTEVKIVDVETSQALPAGEKGEIWVRGPQVMKGYLNNEKATEEMIDKDGWLKTGDLGYYDEDGDFYISDRMKDLIKVKGFQVPPAELEEQLRTHPKILDAAVIGIPHSTKGEVPKAFVVLKQGETATEDEIKTFIKNKVARHKELDGGVTFMDAIPKSAAGKILKKELR